MRARAARARVEDGDQSHRQDETRGRRASNGKRDSTDSHFQQIKHCMLSFCRALCVILSALTIAASWAAFALAGAGALHYHGSSGDPFNSSSTPFSTSTTTITAKSAEQFMSGDSVGSLPSDHSVLQEVLVAGLASSHWAKLRLAALESRVVQLNSRWVHRFEVVDDSDSVQAFLFREGDDRPRLVDQLILRQTPLADESIFGKHVDYYGDADDDEDGVTAITTTSLPRYDSGGGGDGSEADGFGNTDRSPKPEPVLGLEYTHTRDEVLLRPHTVRYWTRFLTAGSRLRLRFFSNNDDAQEPVVTAIRNTAVFRRWASGEQEFEGLNSTSIERHYVRRIIKHRLDKTRPESSPAEHSGSVEIGSSREKTAHTFVFRVAASDDYFFILENRQVAGGTISGTVLLDAVLRAYDTNHAIEFFEGTWRVDLQYPFVQPSPTSQSARSVVLHNPSSDADCVVLVVFSTRIRGSLVVALFIELVWGTILWGCCGRATRKNASKWSDSPWIASMRPAAKRSSDRSV